ncbi:MAG: ornithine cyclodeaminase family protein [Curvibacter sp.]
MLHISDHQVDASVRFDDAVSVLHQAFKDFGEQKAAMQERIRTEAAGVKLSTLGAVIPGQGVTGAKVYTTIAGQFTFVILLFSTETGQPLATFDAAAITRLRTAACSVIAARYLARRQPAVMALLGAGVQGQYHALQMSRIYGLKEIRIFDPYLPAGVEQKLAEQTGAKIILCAAEQAIEGAELIVTASRSTTPLFRGELVAPGAFIAAIGSSLPHTRELDDTTLQRAGTLAVEWKPQSLREAGDLVLAAPASLQPERIVELGELTTGRHPGRRTDEEITIYKTVGVGLEDIALAGLAYRNFQKASAA